MNGTLGRSIGRLTAAVYAGLIAAGWTLLSVAPGHALTSVTLAWDPSPDTNVIGYFIYARAPLSGYSNRVDVGSVTNVTLNTLEEGTTYYYVATAYSAEGIESEPSNEVSYTAPIRTASILQFSTTSYTVSEAGPTVTLTVQRTGGTTNSVTVNWATVNGSAAAGTDFYATNGTLTFAAGQTSQTIAVRTINDLLDETNETFNVTLSTPGSGGVLGTNSTARVTITDDDSGGALNFSASTYSVSETNSSVLISVLRSSGSASNVTVDVVTANGTGFAGTNYVAATNRLTFAASQTSNGCSISILNDLKAAGNKTVLLSLRNPSGGAALGSTSNATLTIIDVLPQVRFENATYTLSEAGGNATIRVLRTGPAVACSVSFATVDGSARAGTDYRATNGVVSFSSSVSNLTFTVPLINNLEWSTNKSLQIRLSSPSNAVFGSITASTLNITNEDLGGNLNFSATSYTGSEASGTASITIRRYGGSASNVTVRVTTTDGSAKGGLDYTATNQTVTFGYNETSKTIMIPIINDLLVETNESFTLTLSQPGNGGSLGTNLTATVTISDNDSGGTLNFSASAYSVNETSSVATITVLRSSGTASNVTVELVTTNGTALAGTNYVAATNRIAFGANQTSNSCTITILNDRKMAGDKSVLLALRNPTGGAVLGSTRNATLTIVDIKPEIRFERDAYTVSESGASATIRVLRTGPPMACAVAFATADGTARAGTDYRATNGILSFSTTVSNLTFTVPVLNNQVWNDAKTVRLSLSSPSNAILGSIPTATLTLTNEDLGGEINFSATNYNVNEYTAMATVTITRSGGAASNVTVQLTSSAVSATAGQDYTSVSQTVRFGYNETSKSVQVPILNDALDEFTEALRLTLSSPTGGARLGARSQATVSISDDDAGGVITFSTPNYSVSETGGVAYIRVLRASGSASNVTVQVCTMNGSALAGSNYVATTNLLTFSAKQTSNTFSIPILNDQRAMGNTTVLLMLRNPTGGATLGTTSNATLTILDVQTGFVFERSSFVASEAASSATIRVLRTGPAVACRVSFATLNGSALAGTDYRATNGTLVFSAGASNLTFRVPVLNNQIWNEDKTVQLSLSSPSNALLGPVSTATLTLTNEDFGGQFNFSATNYTVNETSKTVSVTVARSGGIASNVTVQVTSANNTALAGQDFDPIDQTLSFAYNELSKTIKVTILNNAADEANKQFFLALSDPAGSATLGPRAQTCVTITDDDSGGSVSFGAATYSVSETNSVAYIRVVRSSGSASNVTVEVSTADGTGIAGVNYVGLTNLLTFGSGQTSNTVALSILNDLKASGNQTVKLALRNPAGGARLGTTSNATLTILAGEVPVEGTYRVGITNTYSGRTNAAENGRVTISGDLTVFDQKGNDFAARGLWFNTTRGGVDGLSLTGRVDNAGKMSGTYQSDLGWSGTWTGTASSGRLQMSFTGAMLDEPGTESGRLTATTYLPVATGYATGQLQGVSLQLTATNSTGVLTNGANWLLDLADSDQTYEYCPMPAATPVQQGVYCYTKAAGSTASLLRHELTGLTTSTILTFKSATNGTYSVRSNGTTGTQSGRFNLVTD